MAIQAALNFGRFNVPNPNDIRIITSRIDLPTYVGVSANKSLAPLDLRIQLLKLLVDQQPHIIFIPSSSPFDFLKEVSRLHNGEIELTLLFGLNRNSLAVNLHHYHRDIVKNITLIPEDLVMSDIYVSSLYNNNDYDELMKIYTEEQLMILIDLLSR